MSGVIIRRVPAIIPAGQSLSAAVFCQRLALVGIEMPAAWTAASLTFQMAPDVNGAPGTFLDLWDWTGTEFAASVAAGRVVPFDARAAMAVEWLKVRSGTSGTPVTQGADATVTLLLRSIL